ncbi:MAG TPA: hypothetical protein VFR03_00770 [Thermoanaerobaculia bacterium]|nr:hypothetical protein [Thermoanaerobaculia bacterium]
MQDANNLSVRIRSWEFLDESLQPHIIEMAHLQPLQAEIKLVIGQAKVLHNEQEALKSQLRDITQRRREIERQGDILRRRVEAHLRGSFGHTSEKLISFGVKPRPRVIRRKPRVEEEGTVSTKGSGTSKTA